MTLAEHERHVTAEVKIDETDIVNVRHGPACRRHHRRAAQAASFKGHVTEVGDQALLRTTGHRHLRQSTTGTEEAKDFKVVVTLDPTPESQQDESASRTVLLPPRSRRRNKPNTLTIPIQALVQRNIASGTRVRRLVRREAQGTAGHQSTRSTSPSGSQAARWTQGVYMLRQRPAASSCARTLCRSSTGIIGPDRHRSYSAACTPATRS